MNQAKLLTRIIRRQIEALAAIVAEAELAKDITESEAADLIAGAKVQFELISCKTTRDQKGRGDIASEPKNVEDVIMKLVAEVIGPEGMKRAADFGAVAFVGNMGIHHGRIVSAGRWKLPVESWARARSLTRA